MTRLDPAFLDALSDDLTPVRPLKAHHAAVALAACVVTGLLAVGIGLGPRADIMAGQPSLMFLVRTGLLVPLALICTATALSFARPGIGAHNGFLGHAWAGALAVAATLPLTALAMAAAEPATSLAAIMQPSAVLCLGVSLSSAIVFAGVMVVHLRRGAPVSLERAGLLVGLASGSLGVLIYSLHCPANSIHYIATWYGLAIMLATLAGRLIVPRLIRW